MSHLSKIISSALLGATVLAFGLAASPALAGSCPKESALAKPRKIENAPDVGVTREIRSMVPLKGWRGVGELIEHSTLCAVPIRHRAGGSTAEFGPSHAHW